MRRSRFRIVCQFYSYSLLFLEFARATNAFVCSDVHTYVHTNRMYVRTYVCTYMPHSSIVKGAFVKVGTDLLYKWYGNLRQGVVSMIFATSKV